MVFDLVDGSRFFVGVVVIVDSDNVYIFEVFVVYDIEGVFDIFGNYVYVYGIIGCGFEMDV